MAVRNRTTSRRAGTRRTPASASKTRIRGGGARSRGMKAGSKALPFEDEWIIRNLPRKPVPSWVMDRMHPASPPPAGSGASQSQPAAGAGSTGPGAGFLAEFGGLDGLMQTMGKLQKLYGMGKSMAPAIQWLLQNMQGPRPPR